MPSTWSLFPWIAPWLVFTELRSTQKFQLWREFPWQPQVISKYACTHAHTYANTPLGSYLASFFFLTIITIDLFICLSHVFPIEWDVPNSSSCSYNRCSKAFSVVGVSTGQLKGWNECYAFSCFLNHPPCLRLIALKAALDLPRRQEPQKLFP